MVPSSIMLRSEPPFTTGTRFPGSTNTDTTALLLLDVTRFKVLKVISYTWPTANV